MLTIISTLLFILLGSLFPLFLWTSITEHMDLKLHRFTLTASSLSTIIGVLLFWVSYTDRHVQLSAVVWMITLLTVTWYYWNRRYVQAWVVTIPSFLGLIVYTQMTELLIAPNYLLVVTSILGGLILCGSIFSVVLGQQLMSKASSSLYSMNRLMKCNLLFLTVRMLWDIPNIFISEIDVEDTLILVFHYIQSFDGFFLFIALFFGTLLPLVLYIFVLYNKSTRYAQSTIGLLYVGVFSVTLGTLFYFYYALRFSLYL